MKNFRIKIFLFLCGIMFLLTSCNRYEIKPYYKVASFISAVPNSSTVYSLSNWMGGINGSLNISKLSIPGTHDSGARYEPFPGTAICQTLTIPEQLNAGVRFLDIRCRHVDNAFIIHHGSVFQHLNFQDVLNASLGFLGSNPTECIIMSVKEEYDASNTSRSFEQTFDSYVQQNPGKWYLSASLPTLNQVRGKIVLLRRFSASTTPKGIDARPWGDNTTFTINNANASLKIQDVYKVSDNNSKWSAVSSLFNDSQNESANRLYINYTSGYKPGIFGIPDINVVANLINPKVSNFLVRRGTFHLGIIALDFAQSSRNDLIIKTNF